MWTRIGTCTLDNRPAAVWQFGDGGPIQASTWRGLGRSAVEVNAESVADLVEFRPEHFEHEGNNRFWKPILDPQNKAAFLGSYLAAGGGGIESAGGLSAASRNPSVADAIGR
jgi:hypothetical protein